MNYVLDMQKRNEEIAVKYGSIEEKLTAAENAVQLFETWMTEMAEAFDIPFLWISILAVPENTALIKTLKTSSLLKDRLSVVDASEFAGLAPKGTEPVLVNGELKPFFRLLPKNKFFVKSMAVAPIHIQGRIIGSINHGDASPYRYDPGMDTSLLQSLADRLSTRLSAVAG